jgi:thiol-disulfide isomerase/thioredoxin
MRRLVAAFLCCLALSACTAKPPPKSESGSGVDVDTPALRALKAAAHVATCVPGTAGHAVGLTALPRITLPCLGGGPSVDLSRLRGPMVINLFASWCGPCRAELPYYQKLSRLGAGKVRVLGIDYDDQQPDQALGLVRATGVTYPLLADPVTNLKAAFHRPGRTSPVVVLGLPGIAFVDSVGTVTQFELTQITSYAELRTMVAANLGVHLPK